MALISKQEALNKLFDSDVVALPTETVYGLAAKVSSDQALEKVFSTKKRPFFDPLILHVSNTEMAQHWAHFDPISEKLARHFWPGPLTLVLAKKSNVSDLVTNGGPTVALRSPDHPIFQWVIAEINEPLAAPSANMFGKTSPTTADHVVTEFNKKVSVVDGGPCQMGIESTVVEMNLTENCLQILRPGLIDQTALETFFSKQDLKIKVERKIKSHTPGHLNNHYQPSVPLLLIHTPPNSSSQDFEETLKEFDSGDWQQWCLSSEPSLAARELYGKLRIYSSQGQAIYLKIPYDWISDPKWQALLDRIEKASMGFLYWENNKWNLSKKS